MEYKKSSISKDKIREVIDEELPSIEICNICEMYDVNGVDIRKRLERLLED